MSRFRNRFRVTQLCLAAAAAFLTALSGSHAATTRIMPLGDSITGGPGCWRAVLWQELISNGYTDIDFVGTLPGGGCGMTFDGDNEGHGGYLATNIASQNLLPDWLSATNPDIVLMHLGTNDCWNAKTPEAITAAFSTLIEQMRTNNPKMKILVAKIIPMAPSNCSECDQRVIALNDAIEIWALSKNTSESPVIVVDQWTGFDPATDTFDGVHPNETTGIKKIADKWYPDLIAALNGTIVSEPDFALTPISKSLVVSKGASASAKITIGRGRGFSDEVELSASGLPSGVTASFDPASTTGTSTIITLTASNSASGTGTITIKGVSGSLVRTSTMNITIQSDADAPCQNAIEFTRNINGLNTAGAACYKTNATLNGWGCYNMDGRTLEVNKVTTTCGSLPLPAKWTDGYYYFSFSAGQYPWAGLYSW